MYFGNAVTGEHLGDSLYRKTASHTDLRFNVSTHARDNQGGMSNVGILFLMP